jgi:hypothetical protein
MPESRAKEYWKAVAFIGLTLIVLGLGTIAFDQAFRSLLRLSIRAGGFVLLATWVGVFCHSAGLIGWSALLGRPGRERIALFALGFPLSIILLTFFFGPNDPHGSFPLYILPTAPLFLLAFVLSIMAGFFEF